MPRKRDPKKLFGKVRPRERGDGYMIDCYPLQPRFLYTVSGEVLTEEGAEQLLAIIRADMRHGKAPEDALARFLDPGSSRNAVPRRYSEWLNVQRQREREGDIAPGTLREYERYLVEVQAQFSKATLGDLNAGALEDWALALASRKLRPKTRRNIIGAFLVFLGWCKRRGLLPEVPQAPRIRDTQPYRPEVLHPDEQARVLLAIPEERRGPYLCCAILAMRPGEARAVLVEDVDLTREVLHVRRAFKGTTASAKLGPTKTGRERSLPLPLSLAKWLRQYMPEDGFAFLNPYTGEPWTHAALRDGWLNACQKVLGRKVRFYSGTRHTRITAAIAAGVDSRLAAAGAGHSRRSDQITTYLEPSPDDFRRGRVFEDGSED